MFFLGEKLGKTKAEILALPSREFSEWMAYYGNQAEEQKLAELQARCQQNLSQRKKSR